MNGRVPSDFVNKLHTKHSPGVGKITIDNRVSVTKSVQILCYSKQKLTSILPPNMLRVWGSSLKFAFPLLISLKMHFHIEH